MKFQIQGLGGDYVVGEGALWCNGAEAQEFGTSQEGNKSKCYVLAYEGDVITTRSATTLATGVEEFTDLIVDGILRATSPIKIGKDAKYKQRAIFKRVLYYRFNDERKKGLKAGNMQVQTRDTKQESSGLAMISGKATSAVCTVEIQHWRKYPEALTPSGAIETTTAMGPSTTDRAPIFERYPRWSDLNPHIPIDEPSTFEVGFFDENKSTKNLRDRLIDEHPGFKLFNTCTFRLASCSDLMKLGFTNIQRSHSLLVSQELNLNNSVSPTLPEKGHQSPLLSAGFGSQKKFTGTSNIQNHSLDDMLKDNTLGSGNNAQSNPSLLHSADQYLLGNSLQDPSRIDPQVWPANGPLLAPSVLSRKYQPRPRWTGLGTYPANTKAPEPSASLARPNIPMEYLELSETSTELVDPSDISCVLREPGCGTPDTAQCHHSPPPIFNQGVGLGLNRACFRLGMPRSSNEAAYERCLAIIQQVSNKETSQSTRPTGEAQPLTSGVPFPQPEVSRRIIDFVSGPPPNPAGLPASSREKRKADHISSTDAMAPEVIRQRKVPLHPSLGTNEEFERRTQEANDRIAAALVEKERLERERLTLEVHMLEQHATELEKENAEKKAKIADSYGNSYTLTSLGQFI